MEQTESEVSELQNAFNNLIKEYVICERSWYGRRAKLVREIEKNRIKSFECGEWAGPLQDISQVVREALKQEGLEDYKIKEAIKLLQPEHKRPYEKSGSTLSEPEFQDLEESVFDQTEEFADRTLSDGQLDKLSEAERREVLEQEINTRKSRKTIDNDRIKHLQDYAEKKGHMLVEKVSKQLPPENLRGQTEIYELLGETATKFEVISNMFTDLQKQTYNFKPTPETDKKAIAELEQFLDKSFNPLVKVVVEWCEGVKTVMRNITDEKYSDTNRAWMRNAEDKFLSFGNHGSGEVNAVLTNRVIMKLGWKEVKDEDGNIIKSVPCIIETPVKRETTREELGDMAVFKLAEFEGQMHITCPECKLEFNKPIVTDEQMDLIAGDLFHQAKTTLLRDGLSNAIDTLANNVVTEYIQDPKEWFKQKLLDTEGRSPTQQELKDLTIEEGKPEKIKTVDLDPKDVVEKRHGMLRNAATRRADKSEHFSKEA